MQNSECKTRKLCAGRRIEVKAASNRADDTDSTDRKDIIRLLFRDDRACRYRNWRPAVERFGEVGRPAPNKSPKPLPAKEHGLVEDSKTVAPSSLYLDQKKKGKR